MGAMTTPLVEKVGPCRPLVNLLRKVTSQLAGPSKIWARSTSSDALLW